MMRRSSTADFCQARITIRLFLLMSPEIIGEKEESGHKNPKPYPKKITADERFHPGQPEKYNEHGEVGANTKPFHIHFFKRSAASMLNAKPQPAYFENLDN